MNLGQLTGSKSYAIVCLKPVKSVKCIFFYRTLYSSGNTHFRWWDQVKFSDHYTYHNWIKMSGQSITDRIAAAQHSMTGSAISKAVCKATTHEVSGPKKKHLDCKYVMKAFVIVFPKNLSLSLTASLAGNSTCLAHLQLSGHWWWIGTCSWWECWSVFKHGRFKKLMRLTCCSFV